MKLITLKNNTRDGQLAVLSDDHSHYQIPHCCKTLQEALENWSAIAPQLKAIASQLNKSQHENISSITSHPLKWEECRSPLPRAYQWADGSAYVNHVQLVRKARGATMPDTFWTDPLMYQGGSDTFLDPYQPIQANEDWGIDFEGEIGVITDDVPLGVTPEEAEKHIQLIVLINDVSLRNLVPGELHKGFGFFQSKPSSSFAPIALTPDELGSYWDGKKLYRSLQVTLNGEVIGTPFTGEDMVFSFPELIAHAAKTRALSAGTIIGSGTVSNKDTQRGVACLAEKRMLEIIHHGEAKTSFMSYGDIIQLDVQDDEGHSLFGRIQQEIQTLEK